MGMSMSMSMSMSMRLLLSYVFVLTGLMSGAARAAGTVTAPLPGEATGMVGKNGFLFYRYEIAQASDAPDTRSTLQLLAKMSQQFAANDVTLALMVVPSKIRIYADQLPGGLKLDAYTDGKYEAAMKYLRANNVHVVDLNQAFLRSPVRTSDTPLFLRLDTHWAPSGALLAAQTVRETVEGNPELKRAWQAAPEVPYTLTFASAKVNKRERDLIAQLPKGAPEFAPEQILPFTVARAGAGSSGDLLSQDSAPVLVTTIGSSYTDAILGYPEALRHTLQRDVLDISIPVLRGPWVGMEAYLQDASFQRSRPKLLIWEIPERELRSPPNYRFREARYIKDNQEWLLRNAAWVQKECQQTSIKVTQIETGAQQVLLGFEPALGPLDYVRFSVPPQGSRNWQLEVSNKAGLKRSLPLVVADDEQSFEVKLALPALTGGVEQLRLSAKTAGMAKDWQVCRLPAQLLEK